MIRQVTFGFLISMMSSCRYRYIYIYIYIYIYQKCTRSVTYFPHWLIAVAWRFILLFIFYFACLMYFWRTCLVHFSDFFVLAFCLSYLFFYIVLILWVHHTYRIWLQNYSVLLLFLAIFMFFSNFRLSKVK